MSTSSKLLRLQTYREKRLHSVHAGCVGRLSGPQCPRTVSPGMETLLQVTMLCVPYCWTHSWKKFEVKHEGLVHGLIHLIKLHVLNVNAGDFQMHTVRCHKLMTDIWQQKILQF